MVNNHLPAGLASESGNAVSPPMGDMSAVGGCMQKSQRHWTAMHYVCNKQSWPLCGMLRGGAVNVAQPFPCGTLSFLIAKPAHSTRGPRGRSAVCERRWLLQCADQARDSSAARSYGNLLPFAPETRKAFWKLACERMKPPGAAPGRGELAAGPLAIDKLRPPKALANGMAK